MGGSQSTEIPGGGNEGYHVLKVQEHSPGDKAGLEPFFDFIIAIGESKEKMVRLVRSLKVFKRVFTNFLL